jgi:hypothetical protein
MQGLVNRFVSLNLALVLALGSTGCLQKKEQPQAGQKNVLLDNAARLGNIVWGVAIGVALFTGAGVVEPTFSANQDAGAAGSASLVNQKVTMNAFDEAQDPNELTVNLGKKVTIGDWRGKTLIESDLKTIPLENGASLSFESMNFNESKTSAKVSWKNKDGKTAAIYVITAITQDGKPTTFDGEQVARLVIHSENMVDQTLTFMGEFSMSGASKKATYFQAGGIGNDIVLNVLLGAMMGGLVSAAVVVAANMAGGDPYPY